MNPTFRFMLKKYHALLLAICFFPAAPAARAAEPFSFQPNDVVAIYGNGLADRMQHDPWVETVLQSQLKGMNVSFRNMSFSGDMVNKRPRNQGFTNDEEYLQHVAPDVVFSFYGYNESFAGPDGADAYRGELVKLVERYRELRREKGKDVRFVLFSPIAYENTGDRNLPDGMNRMRIWPPTPKPHAWRQRKRARRLSISTRPRFSCSTPAPSGTRSTAFTSTPTAIRNWPRSSRRSCSAEAHRADDKLADIYAAVQDKNWHWHNRYRATDGNDIWGGRSGLTFVDGQSNADVLKHELGDARRDDGQSRHGDLGGRRGQDVQDRRQQCPAAGRR